jgi:hypothetical protein
LAHWHWRLIQTRRDSVSLLLKERKPGRRLKRRWVGKFSFDLTKGSFLRRHLTSVQQWRLFGWPSIDDTRLSVLSKYNVLIIAGRI